MNKNHSDNNLEKRIDFGSKMRNIVAGTLLGLGTILPAYSQSENSSQADSSRHKIVDSFVIIRNDNKPIMLNVDIAGERYDNRPTIVAYENAKEIQSDFELGIIQGINQIDVDVFMQQVHPKMNGKDFVNYNKRIAAYLTKAFNNEDDGRLVGELDAKEKEYLFKRILSKCDYQEFVTAVKMAYNPTKTTYKGKEEFNPQLKIPVFFKIENFKGSACCPEKKTEEEQKKYDDKVPSAHASDVQAHLGLGAGYVNDMFKGEILGGLRVKDLDLLLDLGYAGKTKENTTRYPNPDNTGTDITDVVKSREISFGGGLGYNIGRVELMALANNVWEKKDMKQTTTQDVRDGLGNYARHTIPGPAPDKTVKGQHLEILPGLQYHFQKEGKKKFGIYGLADFNVDKKRLEGFTAGFNVYF